ncbi:hypothetical protein RHMOL_Rhmol06G0192600 [Rhododendron molle]|uniref:Uncharacterized protein n=4 Tax=Rhododendron molle TaxID=49168 RepID=A0ACC0NGA3_RHOML|nr:hypothetical protein RHMOL_Rhmol06G0192600 [Rhododendron molle]KAI8551512.1 hypothetical protein RHMOL_Rhmol06G0192600 [Rhododendron molle]KAI8551513.1 hypothetical protein RHMOL_Rhmol06G0192600 [Rhododendron molle]KAI8551514.1 hypothetical protein RHMOL_Rhmol06G0192600 [Rhododendron molle]
MAMQGLREFLAELKVHLIGYCVEGSLFLVYEYIENGNLSEHLRGSGCRFWFTKADLRLGCHCQDVLWEHSDTCHQSKITLMFTNGKVKSTPIINHGIGDVLRERLHDMLSVVFTRCVLWTTNWWTTLLSLIHRELEFTIQMVKLTTTPDGRGLDLFFITNTLTQVTQQLVVNLSWLDLSTIFVRVAKYLPPLGSHYHQCYSTSKPTLELQIMVLPENMECADCKCKFLETMKNDEIDSKIMPILCMEEPRLAPVLNPVVRLMYEDKRWVPKDNITKSPARPLEDEASVQRRIPGDRSGHHRGSNSENSSEERKKTFKNIVQGYFATTIFNMLSMDRPSVNSSEAASANDNAWAGFQSAAEGSAADKIGSTEPDAKKTHSSSGIEDLFQDSPSVVSAVSEKPKKDAKTDTSLFDKIINYVYLICGVPCFKLVFSQYGVIDKAILPHRRSRKTGNRFGFVRYRNRRDASLAVANANGLRFGSRIIIVEMARSEMMVGIKELSFLSFRKSSGHQETSVPQPNFHTVSSMIPNQENCKEIEKRVTLNLQRTASGWLMTSAIARLLEITTTEIVQQAFEDLNFQDVSVKSLGGMVLIVTFQSKEDRLEALTNPKVLGWFKSSRLVWLKCRSILLNFWNLSSFKRIREIWGDFTTLDREMLIEESYDGGRMMITTENIDRIDEWINITVRGRNYSVGFGKRIVMILSMRNIYVIGSKVTFLLRRQNLSPVWWSPEMKTTWRSEKIWTNQNWLRNAIIISNPLVQEVEESNVGDTLDNSNQPIGIKDQQVDPEEHLLEQTDDTHDQGHIPTPEVQIVREAVTDEQMDTNTQVNAKAKDIRAKKRRRLFELLDSGGVASRLERNHIIFRNKIYEEAILVDNIKTKIAMWLKACYDLKDNSVEDIRRGIEGIRKLKVLQYYLYQLIEDPSRSKLTLESWITSLFSVKLNSSKKTMSGLLSTMSKNSTPFVFVKAEAIAAEKLQANRMGKEKQKATGADKRKDNALVELRQRRNGGVVIRVELELRICQEKRNAEAKVAEKLKADSIGMGKQKSTCANKKKKMP